MSTTSILIERKSRLNPQFWLWNEVFLPSTAGRVNEMES